ncbi:GNAT family N-acetyltransferase [Shouchella patagoniensis]|uniref:GNAT family N-acetyltransferase n=1 Tax=Shouchella patagoniensis TaxID=228576 RepID=UPI0009949EA4|nr:GNAT family N-acetyltransferase [Shouchella patagoniensis]
MEIRQLRDSDYKQVRAIMNDWWGGRQMADMLPKLFFTHFSSTSLIVEQNNKLIGFLIGFYSQTKANEAYIHFVGVAPHYRKQQLGKKMYTHFFNQAIEDGINTVTCITSPVNRTSIEYHKKMGFELVNGDKEIDGVTVHKDYDGVGKDRVLFLKRLDKKEEYRNKQQKDKEE